MSDFQFHVGDIVEYTGPYAASRENVIRRVVTSVDEDHVDYDLISRFGTQRVSGHKRHLKLVERPGATIDDKPPPVDSKPTQNTGSDVLKQLSKFEQLANDLGKLVTEKNRSYGNSFAQSGEIMAILYPNGIQPAQYRDALAVVRILDKLARIANRKDAFGESPFLDIAGYGIVGAVADGNSD